MEAFSSRSALIDDIWRRRDEGAKSHYRPISDGIAAAKAGGGKKGPLVIADGTDNPGGGGYNDTTPVLQALIDAGIENVAFGTIFDPRNVPLMFGIIILPLTFLGGTYYAWTALEPVKASTHPHPGKDRAVDVDLGAHFGELATSLRPPLSECRQHCTVPCEFVFRIPLRIERQLAPNPFQFVEHPAFGPARLGEQGVQQRTDRGAHIAAVGTAVAFEKPAQRAVGQRLQRRR